MSERPSKTGQTVAGLRLPFGEPDAGAMRGVVLDVSPVKHGSGGTKARITIHWENGFVGTKSDRSVAVVKKVHGRRGED